MTTINEANALRLGVQTVDAVYAGAVKVWPLTSLTMSGSPVTSGDEFEGGVGNTYAGFTVTASGGTPPYRYSMTGALPAGITFNTSTGVMSGTPAAESAGVYPNIKIVAFDSGGRSGIVGPFTLTINYKDPYYANVKLLLDYSTFDGDVTFIDQKFGTAGAPRGTAHHTIYPPPLYGTSSMFGAPSTFGDAVIFADDPKWDLLGLPFTVDFTARPTSLTNASVTFFIGQWGSSVLSWVFYFNQNGSIAFNVSTTGSDNLNPIVSASNIIAVNTWARWRIDYTGTVYRIYKDGVMVAKATATHTKAQINQPLVIGSNGNGNSFNFPGVYQGVRLTVGTARTASDSGYTPSNRPFPFVLIAPVNSSPPVISGPIRVGSTLTASTGTWSGSPTSYTYQWKRGGVDISGATSNTYLTVTADLGATITVSVVATNSVGASAPAVSAAVGPILSVFAKTIDGTAGGQFSNNNTGSVTLTTSLPNDVIVLLFFHESNTNPAATVTSVVSSHLTWTKRSLNPFTMGGTNPCDIEIWWAPSPAVLVNEAIYVTLTGTIDDAAFQAFGVNNCSNINSPWDTHASLATARATGSGSSLTVSNVSTVSTTSCIIGVTGVDHAVTVTNPAGTLKIMPDQNNGGGALWAYITSFYQNNNSALSNASFTTTASGTWAMVIDALT